MRSPRLVLVLAAVSAGVITLVPARAAGPVTLSDVSIMASDGVELVGDVHLPAASGRFPAIVDLEPYGRSSSTEFLANGYAHVNTDVRGSGKSGGALCLLCQREQSDAYEVVEWVAHQPWSNGQVVLSGYSYSAITALLGAALQPPHLKAVIVGHPPTDPYRDVLWHNGLYDQGFVSQWFAGQTGTQALGLGPQPQYLDRKDQLFAIETRLNDLDGPLYQERSVLAKMKKIVVPTYI
ncbi:MAG: hydrolase, CocE/NonD family, partial [Frankiales bacterium]|nr:hydrolase, CocE/NonD family [Frankiales bacterium]